MKKLGMLFLAFVLTLGLAACGRNQDDIIDCLENPDDPSCQVCQDGYELDGTECVLVCEVGYHAEGDNCVQDTVTCDPGYHEEAGQCVLDDTRTEEEILVDYIVDNFDGDIAFLSTALANMDFETALTLTTEFNFEITEDIDEVHYIEALITDSFVYDETNGDKVKRDIYLDIDGEETVEFSIILHEVPSGVHVYLEVEPLIELITEGDPGKIQTVNWVGFDDQWAVFKLDDSLQNVIEFEVIKEMVVSLFFSEMGEQFFYELQENQVEPAIGFDLTQYGVDLGLLVDYIIEENWTQAELLIDSIDYDGIVLNFDAMYVAPELYELIMQYDTELTNAGYLGDHSMLDVATWDAVEEKWVPNLPIDPLDGTEAYFNSLSEADLQHIIEIVFKPVLEQAVYDQLMRDVNPDWLAPDLLNILSTHETFLTDEWPDTSDPFVLLDEQNLVASLGALGYWQALTEDEQQVIRWAVDMASHGWVVFELDRSMERNRDYEWLYRRYEEQVDIDEVYNVLHGLVSNNEPQITTAGYTHTQWVADLESQGALEWFSSLDQTGRDLIVTISQEAGNEMYVDGINMLVHMQMNQHNYQWYYRMHNEYLHDGWLTDSLVDLINSHQTYLTDEHSINVPTLISNIETHGAFMWWMNHASEGEMEALIDISDFFGEDNEGYWAVEQLVRAYESEEPYELWFGRPSNILWPEDVDENLIEFLYENEWFINNEGYHAQSWRNDVENNGGINWYMSLNTAERQALDDAISANEMSMYRWPIDHLREAMMYPDEWSWCYGNWEHCMDTEHSTDEMVMLINNYSVYLTSEYGYNVPNLVADVEMYGAIDWFLHHADDDDREAMLDIAEQDHWAHNVLWKLEDLDEMEDELEELLTTHLTELNDAGYAASQRLSDLQTYGLQDFVENYMDEDDVEFLFEEYLYPVLEDLLQAIEDEEVIEFAVEQFFTDPHVLAALADIGVNPVFDHTIIAANMIAIDFDALVLEEVDVEALATAIYEGQTSYDTFVAGLNTTAPNMGLFLAILSPGVDSLQPYMVYVDDLEYAFEGLEAFDQFIDPDYYLDNIFDIDVVKTEDIEVLTIFEIDGLGYAEMFNDLTDQLGIYMTGFETVPFPFDQNWDCLDPLDPDCEEPDFASVIAELSDLGSVYFHVLYDPSDLTWVQYGFDASELLNGIAEDEYAEISAETGYVPHSDNNDWTGVNEAYIVITLSDTSSITLPAETDTTDANAVIEDFAKFGLTMEAYEILEDFAYYYSMNPAELTPLIGTDVYLEDIDFMNFSAAFDLEMSYISVSATDFAIELYWIDGTEVFDTPVGEAEIAALFSSGEVISEAAYDTMVAKVNDTNWALTKLWLYFLWQDNDYDEMMD